MRPWSMVVLLGLSLGYLGASALRSCDKAVDCQRQGGVMVRSFSWNGWECVELKRLPSP